MAELEQFLDAKTKIRSDFIKKHIEPFETEFETFAKDFEAYAKTLIRAKKTGNYRPVGSKRLKVRESMKENSCPNTEIANYKRSNQKEINAIKVKTEKLSTVKLSVNNVVSEEMPAPKMVPPKKRVKKEKVSINVKSVRGRDNSEYKRTTRSCAIKTDRNSDVIIQSTPIPVVNLSDSEEEKTEAPVRSTRTRTKKNSVSEESAPKTIRSTRTRTKNKIQLKNEMDTISTNDNNEMNIFGSEDEGDVSSASKSNAEEINKGIDVPDQSQRITRTKTKVKSKRDRSQSEVTFTKPKRSKSDSNINKEKEEEKNNTSGRTEYEDAVSDTEACKNATFVLPMKHTDAPQSQNEDSHGHNTRGRTDYKDAVSETEANTNSTFVLPVEPNDAAQSQNADSFRQVANQTVVLGNINKIQLKPVNNVYDLLTDDDSVEEQLSISPHKKKNGKEVFSPYVTSPVKQKVEAFEKYQQHDALGSRSKANTSRVLRDIEENKGNVKEKAMNFTPNSTKTLYRNGPPSSSKISKYVGYKSTHNDSVSSKYSHVKLLKTSTVDYREKELKLQERELRKQEMMKCAASVERKRKYEEKLLKVQQQQREAMERDKLKAKEVQRLKEERSKQMLQRKEEKHRQMKEENEKKRLLAKQRAEEKRKEEESLRILAHKEKLKNDQLSRKAEAEDLRKKALQKSVDVTPVYMTKPAPYLNCEDCYDSDDEDYNKKRWRPEWATKYKQYEMDRTQTILGHRIKNSLFCCHNHTVDLREIFGKIDPRKLKRTSSANWSKPPRFTMLPDF